MRCRVLSVVDDLILDFGDVILPARASDGQVAAALQAIGIYAPRGADFLEWVDDDVGTIFDANGYPIVYLTNATSKLGGTHVEEP